MSRALRANRGQPAPRRWGWLAAVVGLVVAAVGGWLEYSDRPVAANLPSESAASSRAPATATDRNLSRPPSATEKPAPKSQRPAKKPADQPATKPTKKPAASTTSPAPGRPERILVPELGVSAPVVAIQARNGSLTPPSNPRVVGWWSEGAQPGARRGSAVITGHTVHNGGGAFDDLDRLTPGDQIIVTTHRGQLRYVVDEVRTYRKAALAKHAAEIFDQSVPGRLVLITCEDWNGSVYLSNAVVVAHRVK